jgi:hypothetical protein
MHLQALSGCPAPRKESNNFTPVLDGWLQEERLNLFALEVLYIAFTITTSGKDSHLHSALSLNGAENYSSDRGPISPWGSTLPSALYQLLLVRLPASSWVEWFFYSAPTLGLQARKTLSASQEEHMEHLPGHSNVL